MYEISKIKSLKNFENDLPPPISPLVVMADMDRAVTKVMKVDMAMMISICPAMQHFYEKRPIR